MSLFTIFSSDGIVMETRFYDFMAATSRDDVAEVPRHGCDETGDAAEEVNLTVVNRAKLAEIGWAVKLYMLLLIDARSHANGEVMWKKCGNAARADILRMM